jgi:hypothetical protein
MKNTFKAFIALFMIAGLWSCEDDENFMIAEPQEAAFAILTPDSGSSIIITEQTPQENVGATFTWEDVDYGTPTAVTYTLEAAANGSDFATVTTLTSSAARNYSITYAALQTLANSFDTTPGGDPADAVAIDFRVKSTVGTTGAEPKYSNVVTIAVTPFIPTVPPVLFKRELYLVGNSVDTNLDGVTNDSDWNNNGENAPIFRDGSNDDLYYYVGYFNAGEFKLLEKKGQWQPQWGSTGGALAVNDGSGSDPGAFTVSAPGYYSLTVDLASLTYTFEPYTGDTATTIPTVGIIGTATANGWDASTAMTAPNALNPHMWKINATLTDGEMKFRANDAWDLAWGANTPLSGLGSTAGGAPNVPVTAGEYDVWFNDLDGRYLLIPQE